MGWSIGYSERYKRDIGYGVPAYCDHPGCREEIDRGLGYKCEEEECGCEKFYCFAHLYDTDAHTHEQPTSGEHPDWMNWKLTDASWQLWRDENPELVEAIRVQLKGLDLT
ncbi:hypothetical protein [Pseudoxanthomonas sp. PXM05]|uniref:hypothetical protein n=1 Tax=Pseudoxanthomonas sp. PXM05 TaxID=2854775 RepID=UPI001C47C17C|nr:hypothetical protein [Pseudoxanthomonas sp. PXM05]MBV7475351.1 hypothetical protein [Pseudoxanthomonas sp. PXM05]